MTLRTFSRWLAVLLSSQGATLMADDGVRSNPYSEGFLPKWSYFHHTPGDDAALTASGVTLGSSAGAVTADERLYVKLVGPGKMVEGLVPGDYLKIEVTGNMSFDGGAAEPFVASGVLVDRPLIRQRIGYGDRFLGIANQLQVFSLGGSPFVGVPGQWPGQINATQDATVKDFRIGSSAGEAVIVKVPQPPDPNFDEVYLFKSVNRKNFSGIANAGGRIKLTKLDPTSGRSVFSIKPTSTPGGTQLREITEGVPATLIVRRQNAIDLPAKVSYTVTRNGADFNADALSADPLVFPAGISEMPLPVITASNDSLHEGPETFSIQLTVNAGDNPNEAYVEGSGNFVITIKDAQAVPTVYFSSPTSSVAEPASGFVDKDILVELDHKSVFPVNVWYATNQSTTTANWGEAGVAGRDANYISAGKMLTIPANSKTGSFRVRIHSDGVYEGTETFSFGLGTVATNATYLGGKHTLSITDSFTTVPGVAASLQGSSILDEGGATGPRTISFSRATPSAFPSTVALNFSGTAITGDDFLITGANYNASGRIVTIPASTTGPTISTITVSAVNDSTLEFDETVGILMGNPVTNGLNGTLSSPAGNPIILTITDDDDGDYADSTPTEEAGETKPSNIGRIAVTVAGSPFPAGSTPVALWRIVGEPSWRLADDPLTTENVEGRFSGLMCPGYHQIEFRPLEGYESPGRQVIHVTDGETVFVPAHYIDIDAGSPGSLTVQLTPAAAAAAATPEVDRLQWRLEGESAWRDAGSQVAGLPAGSHKVVFKKVAGRAVPIPRVIKILPGSAASFTLAYVDLPANPPRRPEVLAPATTDAEPYAFCGRISSSAGYGTGTAIRERVVLTAAHVLFDDDSLTFATDVRWHHQAHRGHYQPGTASAAEYDGIENQAGILGHSSSMIPRGWVMTAGYAAQREMDVFGEYSAGIGSPESQDMDIAAAFFTDAVAGDAVNPQVARGGHAGMYYREAAMPQGNFFIGTQKLLIGYPVEGYSDEDRGKMHGSDPAGSAAISLLHSHGNVFTSPALVGAGGISGGPLMVRGTDSEPWRVAAIFLGGVGQGIYYQLHEELFEESTGPGVGDGVIAMADKKSNAGDEGSGDGSTTVTQSTTQSSSDVSAAIAPYTTSHIRFVSNHPAARWAKKPARISQVPAYVGTESLLTLPSGSSERIVFKPLAGWITPAEVTLATPELPGAVGEHRIRYIPTTYASLQSLIAATYPAATPEQTGPEGDVDGDGVANLLEWAFNLDPLTPDRQGLVPGSGRSGLPVVSLVGGDSLRRLKIEYVKLRNAGPAYAVEFSSGGTWTSGGNLIATSPIDANWERVVVEDGEVGLSRRFVRVKVTEAP